MEVNINNFPSHLTRGMVTDITSFNLCTYLIGLEGWRRGLKLTYYNKITEEIQVGKKRLNNFGRLYSLSNNEKTHYFYQSRGDRTESEAIKVAKAKELTKNKLMEHDLPILTGKSFDKNVENKDVIEAAKKIGYPVIIKPTNGSLSKGVILNIKNDKELENSLNHVRNRLGYKSVILEKYFDGEDVRVNIVGNEVVAGIKRIPAKITGNGYKSIEELIKEKNESRKINPYLNARLIKINKETRDVLETQGYKLKDILESGKTILVKNKSTLTQGVDLEDITDIIPDDMKKIAINAVNAIPGLKQASIDFLVNGNEAYILEINSAANISMHLFPTIGKPRNVPAAIVDYYFPETIELSSNNTHMSFNYVHLLETLKYNYTDKIEVRSLSENHIPTYLVEIKGDNFNSNFIKNIYKKAMQRSINGSVDLLNDKRVILICASYIEKDISWLLKQIDMYKKSRVKVTAMESQDYNGHVDIGFKIIE